MEKKISDILDGIMNDSVRLDAKDVVSVERIKDLTMRKIDHDYKQVLRKSSVKYLVATIIAVAFVALSGAALAATGVVDFGAFYDSFFKNAEVTDAITPNISNKSADVGISLTNAYTDGLTTHLALQVTGLADKKFHHIQFRTDPQTGYTVFARDGFTLSDSIITVPATIFLPGTEAEKTGHVALVITEIALDPYTPDERDIPGNWDLTFDIKLPDADKTHMTFTVPAIDSPYIDEVTFDIRPATFEVTFTAKGGKQDLTALMKYFQSYSKPILTLDDGTVVKVKGGGTMIDATMGSWWGNTEYFDISKLKSITFCGQTYDVEQR
jgi:hypothetical protein